MGTQDWVLYYLSMLLPESWLVAPHLIPSKAPAKSSNSLTKSLTTGTQPPLVLTRAELTSSIINFFDKLVNVWYIENIMKTLYIGYYRMELLII